MSDINMILKYILHKAIRTWNRIRVTKTFTTTLVFKLTSLSELDINSTYHKVNISHSSKCDSFDIWLFFNSTYYKNNTIGIRVDCTLMSIGTELHSPTTATTRYMVFREWFFGQYDIFKIIGDSNSIFNIDIVETIYEIGD